MKDILIDEEATIREAMELLDESGKRILFVLNDNILVASLTDGDLRRALLKEQNLDKRIKTVANYCPIFLHEEQAGDAEKVIKREQVDAVPIVNQKHEIIRIVFSKPIQERIQKFDCEVPVVIMAGGMGTRLQPYTEVLPKPLIPIDGLPIIEHIIGQFSKYGCNQFNIVVNYKRNMIKAYFDDIEKGYQINYVFEEKQLGTGGGISLLQGEIDKTFILSNCDILIDENMVDVYKKHKNEENIITIICAKKNYVIPYGVITLSSDGRIDTMQERPQIDFLTNTGCYIVEPRVLEEMPYNESIDFPDIIKGYISRGEKIGVYIIQDNKWADMGEMEELKILKQRLEY